MKTFLVSLVLALSAVHVSACADDKPKEEKKCITVIDSKTKKEVEKCRVIKKHEKLEKVTPTPGK